jgi:acetyl esterase/lipase
MPVITIPLTTGPTSDESSSLVIHLPDRHCGAAIVVCPGGGYGGLAAHEADPVAQWCNSIGVVGAVLKYRLGPKNHHPVPLSDAQAAIALLKSRAAEFKLDPKRIGILGFSAGGHLASTAATHFTGPENRPDIAILIYPVIAMDGPFSHAGSRRNLLGDAPSAELVASLSNHTQITKDTPPMFLVHGMNDHVVPIENSLQLATALAARQIPFAAQLYENGPHGFGMGELPETAAWPSACASWLKARGFTK